MLVSGSLAGGGNSCALVVGGLAGGGSSRQGRSPRKAGGLAPSPEEGRDGTGDDVGVDEDTQLRNQFLEP